MEQNKENSAEVTKPTSEHLAMEILKQSHEKNRALNKGLLIGMGMLAAVSIAVTISSTVERAHLVEVNYQNDCEWRALFESYDFISQDGDGINSANYGEQGDLNNGATSKDVEE